MNACHVINADLKIDRSIAELFNNLPKLIRPKILARELDIAVATIYDWKYRAKMRKIPENLFLKIAGRLYVRTDVLSLWIMSGNASHI